MPRIRDLGLYDDDSDALPPGSDNAITDVAGVLVGHTTVVEGEGAWSRSGPFRTGVTVIRPHGGNLYEDKVAAGVAVINGFGKYAGFDQLRETGALETPIALTSTLNMPRVADALTSLAIEASPHIGLGFAETGRRGYASVNPVVGECNDGFLNDAQARRIGAAEVRAAFAGARGGAVAEGCVGAGTGTSCFEWKGGIGTASRLLPKRHGGFTVGALVQSNFGEAPELTVRGVPVGQTIRPPQVQSAEAQGSIMMVLATDAPLDGRQLERLCGRAAFGLARTGSTCAAGSGDVAIGFSTTTRIPDRPKRLVVERATLANEQMLLSRLGQAVVEAVEEAIYNSLFMAETVVGRDGNTRHALPVKQVAALVRRCHRTGP